MAKKSSYGLACQGNRAGLAKTSSYGLALGAFARSWAPPTRHLPIIIETTMRYPSSALHGGQNAEQGVLALPFYPGVAAHNSNYLPDCFVFTGNATHKSNFLPSITAPVRSSSQLALHLAFCAPRAECPARRARARALLPYARMLRCLRAWARAICATRTTPPANATTAHTTSTIVVSGRNVTKSRHCTP